MTSFTMRALERANLAELVSQRAAGTPLTSEHYATFAGADLLLLGTAADEVRRQDCGDDVIIHPPCPSLASAHFMVVGTEETRRGTHLFRALALARLQLPSGSRLSLDFDVFGLAIAQASLAFGVSDLTGTLRSRKGLALLGDSLSLDAKKRELAGCIARAGRRAVFEAG